MLVLISTGDTSTPPPAPSEAAEALINRLGFLFSQGPRTAPPGLPSGPPPPPTGPEPPELPPPRQPQPPRNVLPDPNQENINPSLRPGVTAEGDAHKGKAMQGKEIAHNLTQPQQNRHPMLGGMVVIPGHPGRTQDGDGEPLSKVPRHPNDNQISYNQQQPPQPGFNQTGRGSGRGGNPPAGFNHSRKGSGRGKNPQTGFTQTGRGSGRGSERKGSGAGLNEGTAAVSGKHIQQMTNVPSQGAPQVPMQQVPHTRNQIQIQQLQQQQQMHQMHMQQQQYQLKMQQTHQQMYLQQKQQMQQLQQHHQMHHMQQNVWQQQQRFNQQQQQQQQQQHQQPQQAHGNGVVQGKTQTVADQRFATVQSIPTNASRKNRADPQHSEPPPLPGMQDRVGKLPSDNPSQRPQEQKSGTGYPNGTNHNRTGLVPGVRASTLESRSKQNNRGQAPKTGSQGRPASYQSPGNEGGPSLENRLQQLLEGGVKGRPGEAVTNGNTAPNMQKPFMGGPNDSNGRSTNNVNKPVSSHMRQQSVDMIKPKMAHPRKILNTSHQRGASLDSSANDTSNISFNSTTSSVGDTSFTSVSSMEGYDMSSMQAPPTPTSPRDVMANIEGNLQHHFSFHKKVPFKSINGL